MDQIHCKHSTNQHMPLSADGHQKSPPIALMLRQQRGLLRSWRRPRGAKQQAENSLSASHLDNASGRRQDDTNPQAGCHRKRFDNKLNSNSNKISKRRWTLSLKSSLLLACWLTATVTLVAIDCECDHSLEQHSAPGLRVNTMQSIPLTTSSTDKTWQRVNQSTSGPILNLAYHLQRGRTDRLAAAKQKTDRSSGADFGGLDDDFGFDIGSSGANYDENNHQTSNTNELSEQATSSSDSGSERHQTNLLDTSSRATNNLRAVDETRSPTASPPPSSSASLMAPLNWAPKAPKSLPKDDFSLQQETSEQNQHGQATTSTTTATADEQTDQADNEAHSSKQQSIRASSQQIRPKTVGTNLRSASAGANLTISSNGHQGDQRRHLTAADDGPREHSSSTAAQTSGSLGQMTISTSWPPSPVVMARARISNQTKATSADGDNKSGAKFSTLLSSSPALARGDTTLEAGSRLLGAGKHQIKSSLASRAVVRVAPHSAGQQISKRLTATAAAYGTGQSRIDLFANKSAQAKLNAPASPPKAPVHAKARQRIVDWPNELSPAEWNYDKERADGKLVDYEERLQSHERRDRQRAETRTGSTGGSHREQHSSDGGKGLETGVYSKSEARNAARRRPQHAIETKVDEIYNRFEQIATSTHHAGRLPKMEPRTTSSMPQQGSSKTLNQSSSKRAARTSYSANNTLDISTADGQPKQDSNGDGLRPNVRYALYDLSDERSGTKTSEFKTNFTKLSNETRADVGQSRDEGQKVTRDKFEFPAVDKTNSSSSGGVKRRDVWNKLLSVAPIEHLQRLNQTQVLTLHLSPESTAKLLNKIQPNLDFNRQVEQVAATQRDGANNSLSSLLSLPEALANYVQIRQASGQDRSSIVRSGFVMPGTSGLQAAFAPTPALALLGNGHVPLPMRALDQLRATLASRHYNNNNNHQQQFNQQTLNNMENLLPHTSASPSEFGQTMSNPSSPPPAAVSLIADVSVQQQTPPADQMLATANQLGVSHLGPHQQMMDGIGSDSQSMSSSSSTHMNGFSPTLGSLQDFASLDSASSSSQTLSPSTPHRGDNRGESPASGGALNPTDPSQARQESARASNQMALSNQPHDHDQQHQQQQQRANSNNNYSQDYSQTSSSMNSQQQHPTDTSQSFSPFYESLSNRNSSMSSQSNSLTPSSDYYDTGLTRSSSPNYYSMRLEHKSSNAADSMLPSSLRNSLDVFEEPTSSLSTSEYERDLADLDDEFNRNAIFQRPSSILPSSSRLSSSSSYGAPASLMSDSMLAYSPDRYESGFRFNSNPNQNHHHHHHNQPTAFARRRPTTSVGMLQQAYEHAYGPSSGQDYSSGAGSSISNMISQRPYNQLHHYHRASSNSGSLWPSTSNSFAFTQAVGSNPATALASDSDMWLADSSFDFNPLASFLSPSATNGQAGKWRSPMASNRYAYNHLPSLNHHHYQSAPPQVIHQRAHLSAPYYTLAPLNHHQQLPHTAAYMSAASEQPTYSLVPTFAASSLTGGTGQVAAAPNSAPETVSFTISPLAAAAAAAATALAAADKSRHNHHSWTFTLPRLASALAAQTSSAGPMLTPAASTSTFTAQPTFQYATSTGQYRPVPPAGPYLLSPVPLYAFAGARPLTSSAAAVSGSTSSTSASAPPIVPFHTFSTAAAAGSSPPTMLAYRPTSLFASTPLLASFAYPVRLPLPAATAAAYHVNGHSPAHHHHHLPHYSSQRHPIGLSSTNSHSTRGGGSSSSSSSSSKPFLVDLQFAESKPKHNNNQHGAGSGSSSSETLVKVTTSGITQIARNLTKKLFGSASQIRPQFAAPPANFEPVFRTPIAISPGTGPSGGAGATASSSLSSVAVAGAGQLQPSAPQNHRRQQLVQSTLSLAPPP